jgi:hypothetical protein
MGHLLASRDRYFKSRGLGYPTPRMSPGWRCARASSFISLRGIPQPSALAHIFERNSRVLKISSEATQDVSRSEIKEETAKRAGDIRGGSRPVAFLSEPISQEVTQGAAIWAS